MLALAAAVLFSSEPMIAYAARIYYPYGDKRTSHYQLYVSDLHGYYRKQLTYGKNDPRGVSWISRDALCWMDQEGNTYVSKLNPFKPKKVALPIYPDYQENRTLDGMPRGLVLVGGKQLTAGGLKPYNGQKNWPEVKETTKESYAYQYTMPGGKAFVVDLRAYTLSFDDKSYNFENRGSWLYPIRLDGDVLWVKARNYGGLHGRIDEIYKFRMATGTYEKVIGEIGYIDFTPDSPYYAGMDLAGEDLIPYGPKKSVAGAHLFAGNWQTKKRWLVQGGTVHVASVSIQPEK